MQRWTALLLAVLLAASLGVVVWKAGPGEPSAKKAPGGDGGVAMLVGDAGIELDASLELAMDDDAGLGAEVEVIDPGSPFEPKGTSDAGVTLLSGELAPPLAAEAPKTVVFGVILVTYRGAQGAPAKARTRDEALALAKTLAEEAKTDFKAAVAKGDKGSIANAGKMPRGVLEPAPEYVLFSLAKGDVSEPVDTPRGFWIAQRVE